MQVISKKKNYFPVTEPLRQYLAQHRRKADIPVHYSDLTRFSESVPLLDKNGKDTLWETVIYNGELALEINAGLAVIYSILKEADEDLSQRGHLVVDRIDCCVFGNTKPFRIRIVNQFNDNYDYFYVKKADSSRIYGLELEELLSPSRIHFLVKGETLIEEHVSGIPGDRFLGDYLKRANRNLVRVAKEFIKFNERCFVRLLGDMRSYNYVVDITPDFEDEQYRVRPIDFDQQSYEGKKNIYLPQFFKDNNPVVKLCLELLNVETMRQYQREERTLMAKRFHSVHSQIKDLVSCMQQHDISTKEKVAQLREELSHFHGDSRLLKANTMGDILYAHIVNCLDK
jgi:hypothetical protein